MLPVSGAWQLIASGAITGDQPDTSATGAYSRFDSPETSGRNRFHSPRSRASAFSSSTTGRQVPLLRRAAALGAERLVPGLRREDLLLEEGAHALGVVGGHGAGCEVHDPHANHNRAALRWPNSQSRT